MAQKGLLIGGILLTVVFVVAAIVVGIILAVDNGLYVSGPSMETVTNASGHNMTLFSNAGLYPFNGTPDDIKNGQTPSTCIDVCVANPRCQGFFIHTENSLPVNQGSCSFYYGNNVQDFVGSHVNLPGYFTAGNILVGTQQPLTATDVYLKTNTAYNIFRTSYDSPTTVSL